MRKVLYILGDLNDKDVDWITATGRKQVCAAGSVLIHEGQEPDSLFFVLDGRLNVLTRALGDHPLAELGSGEIVGEVSFVDARPATATVKAAINSLVLRIARTEVTAKLESDPAFAARFYRALATFLANRLRNTLTRLNAKGGSDANEEGDADEIDPGLLDSLGLAAARFDWILKRLKGV